MPYKKNHTVPKESQLFKEKMQQLTDISYKVTENCHIFRKVALAFNVNANKYQTKPKNGTKRTNIHNA